jgi:hypothetical protein
MYLELALSKAAHYGLCAPEEGIGMPPTAGGRLLAAAWIRDESVIENGAVAAGVCVKASTGVVEAEGIGERCIEEWIRGAPLMEGLGAPPQWVSKNDLRTVPDARLLEESAGGARVRHVFVELMSETKAKWRYLSLYRVFECGYLATILDSFNERFFESPMASVGEARVALESELTQFLALVTNAGLEAHFGRLHDAFESARGHGNKFAVALDRALRRVKQPEGVSSKEQKGVWLCYRIRCAIVHAGIETIVFDAFPDAAVCVEALLPACEAAVLEYVGVVAI